MAVGKDELVKKISENSGLTEKDAEKALKGFTEAITDFLADGEKVQIVGFGTFEVSERAARTGRNPKTGEEIQIEAKKVPKFSAGKALKNAVE